MLSLKRFGTGLHLIYPLLLCKYLLPLNCSLALPLITDPWKGKERGEERG
jgi:hypothetical protein